jgi:hypothetical protein
VLRINITFFGIQDLHYVVFTNTFMGIISQSLSLLPTLVLFTKVTPNLIEASIFALLAGVSNFSDGVASPLIGSVICKLMGVDGDHLDKYS